VGFLRCYWINAFCITLNYICQTKNNGCFTSYSLNDRFLDLYPDYDLYAGIHVMIELIGRLRSKTVDNLPNNSLLDLAIKHEIPWLYSCTRGTCARCRCLVSEGSNLLNEPTEMELDRLEPEEFAQGFRLACQAKVEAEGLVKVSNVPYF
jgi:2Fe-2S ferredoxin